MGDVAQAATLLDFSKPIDVCLLDATVNLSMQSVVGGEQQVRREQLPQWRIIF